MSPGQSNASHHCPLLPAAAITQMGRWLLLLPLALTPGATLQALRLPQPEGQGRGKNPSGEAGGGLLLTIQPAGW